MFFFSLLELDMFSSYAKHLQKSGKDLKREELSRNPSCKILLLLHPTQPPLEQKSSWYAGSLTNMQKLFVC